MKLKYEITHYNPTKQRTQHNTFHTSTLEEAIERYKAKGYHIDNIRSVKQHTTQEIDFKHLYN